MTRDETKKILNRVCRLYVTQARKLSPEQKAVMVDTWATELKDDDYAAVDKAISSYMRKGKPFMPDVVDIINILTSVGKPSAGRTPESTRLFDRLEQIADTVANNKPRMSIVDPGGYKWDPERKRDIYYHAELITSNTSFTQYDFAQLPEEIQEYAEDVEGLRTLHREIQSNREMARKRFEATLPSIREDLEKQRKSPENRARVDALIQKMLGARNMEVI